MTSAYISKALSIIRHRSGQKELGEDISKRLYEITKKNTSHAPEFKRESFMNITLVHNGEQLGEFDVKICYLEDEIKNNIDVDDDTAFLFREYLKREETLATLEVILLNQGKSDILAELPELKDIFREADEEMKEEKIQKENKWIAEIAVINEFMAS